MDWLTHRRRALLYASAFLMDLAAFAGLTAIFLLLARHFESSLRTQGLVSLLRMVVYLGLCPVVSRLARRRSRRLAFMVMGPPVLAGAYALIAASATVGQVMVLSWVNAVAAAFFWPQLEAEIGHGVSGRPLGRRMGMFNISWSVGSTLAPFVGALLYDVNGRLDHRLPFIAAAAAGLAVAGLMLLYRGLCRRAGERIDLPPPAKDHGERIDLPPPATDHGEPQRPVPSVMPTMLVLFVWLAWLGNFVAYANQSIARTLFQQVAAKNDFTNVQIGWAMAALGVTRTLMLVVLQCTQRWVYRARYLYVFQGVLLGGVFLMCLSGGPAQAAIAMGLIGMGAAMAYTASMFYSVEGAHHGKASTGLHEAVIGGGGAVGVLVAGQIAPRLTADHPRSPFYGGFALAAACLVVQAGVHLVYRRRAERRKS